MLSLSSGFNYYLCSMKSEEKFIQAISAQAHSEAAGNSYFLGINSNDIFLKDNKKAFILWLNVPKVTASINKVSTAINVCFFIVNGFIKHFIK